MGGVVTFSISVFVGVLDDAVWISVKLSTSGYA